MLVYTLDMTVAERTVCHQGPANRTASALNGEQHRIRTKWLQWLQSQDP